MGHAPGPARSFAVSPGHEAAADEGEAGFDVFICGRPGGVKVPLRLNSRRPNFRAWPHRPPGLTQRDPGCSAGQLGAGLVLDSE